MSSVPYRISDKTITIVVDRQVHTVQRSAANADALIAELAKGESADLEAIKAMASVKNYIVYLSQGRISLTDAGIQFMGELVNSYMTERIMRHHAEGVDVAPMLAFMDRVMNHPILGIQQDIYKWCEKGDMPFTAEGHIIAYKKVREDYRSYHSSPDGTHLHHPIGGFVEMERSAVDPRRNNTCSTGLHFCSYDYLNAYQGANTGRILILSIDPQDVIAIPTDYNQTKGRACRYRIIGELPQDQAQKFFMGKLVVDQFQTYKAEPKAEPVVQKPDTSVKKSKAKKPTKTTASAKKSKKLKAKEKAKIQQPKLRTQSDLGVIEHKNLSQPVSYSEVLAKVQELGQTGAGKFFGVARTTIQEWVKKINK